MTIERSKFEVYLIFHAPNDFFQNLQVFGSICNFGINKGCGKQSTIYLIKNYLQLFVTQTDVLLFISNPFFRSDFQNVFLKTDEKNEKIDCQAPIIIL